MKRKPKKQRSIIVRLLVLGVCAYMAITLGNLWNNLNEANKELKKLQQQKEIITVEIEEYKSLLNGDEKKIIEKAARERLGYHYPEEQVFKDVSGTY